MSGLRCISLHQPWASLVALGVKTIETRSWATKHRGRIGIASTAKKPVQGEDVGDWWADYDVDHWIIVHDYKPGGRWSEHDASLGALVATANLVDCVPMVAEGELGATGGTGPLIAVSRSGEYVTFLTYEPNAVSPGRYIDKERTEDLIGPNRPYGDFAPGRWAWLLDDVKPTTERCPRCGFGSKPGYRWHDGPGTPCWVECPTCDGNGKCDPVPVKGHQRMWLWAP